MSKWNLTPGFCARTMNQEQLQPYDPSSLLPRSDTDASFATFQAMCQHQTKRGKEPIRPARTAEIVTEAAQLLPNSPRQSMRAMVKDLYVSEGMVCIIVKETSAASCKPGQRDTSSAHCKGQVPQVIQLALLKRCWRREGAIMEERGQATF